MSPNVAKSTLTAKQAAAVAALLEGQTQAGAARAAGVAKKTIQRWMGDPAFVAELRAGGDVALRTASARLDGLTESAVTALLTVRHEPTSPGAAVQLRAAIAIMEQAVRIRDHIDILDRLAAVEAKLGTGEN
jgi:hypothetical protein